MTSATKRLSDTWALQATIETQSSIDGTRVPVTAFDPEREYLLELGNQLHRV
jgi:hypothetical protein